MRSALFYALHSIAIIALMLGSYAYGLKQSVKKSISKSFYLNK